MSELEGSRQAANSLLASSLQELLGRYEVHIYRELEAGAGEDSAERLGRRVWSAEG